MVLAALVGFAAWTVLLAPSDLPPKGLARGNGRIEADMVDVSTRPAGRIAEIALRERDLVQADLASAALRAKMTSDRSARSAAELSDHLDLSFTDVTATAFFMLGAAAMVFTTSFFGFFSSRRRFVMPLAMVSVLFQKAASIRQRIAPYLVIQTWP